MKFIVGLGNPGEKYEGNRHNIGRDILFNLQKKYDFGDWNENKKTNALEATGEIGKEKVVLILPNTFMNHSGKTVAKHITSKKKLIDLLVIYDDIDLGLGTLRLSHNRGSGGHKGLESVIRALKSREFSRLRIGIVPVTPTGKLKKPKGESKVVDHVLGTFSKSEEKVVDKVIKDSLKAVELFVGAGYLISANQINSK